MTERGGIKKFALPAMMRLVFEAVAVALWLSMGNRFYLFNFSYIGTSVAAGLLLFQLRYKHARRVAHFVSICVLWRYF